MSEFCNMDGKVKENRANGLRFVSCLLTVLVAAPALAQIQATMEYQSQFGQFGRRDVDPPTGFSAPTGVDFYDADRLIVADRGNLRLQSCDLQGDCFWIGGEGLGLRNSPGTFDLPHGVEVNGDGFIAVADEDNHAVQRCTEEGNCLYSGNDATEDNKCASGLGRWCLPQDTAYNAAGQILGLDTGNHRIQVLRLSDLQVQRVHSLPEGTAVGQTDNPGGIAVDAEDRILIADTGNNRVQVCTKPAIGNTLECKAFGSKGTAPGKFNGPVGIDVDSLDRIWVADTGNNRIQVCDHQGDCVAFGEYGDGPFQFDAPQDVAVHPSGLVAVVDTNNNRIELFRTEAAFSINAGMSDAWVNPLVDRQGFLISVWPQLHKMFLAQFTFDVARPDAGVTADVGGPGQRWVTALGDYAGARAVLSAELTTGMLFDSAEPAAVQTPGYGTYTVTFEDCEHGTIAYDFPDLDLSGEIPIERIAADNAAVCEALQGQ